MSHYSDRMVEDAIELHTPDGARKIAMPGECDITRVGAMVLQLMEAAGYEYMRPQCGGAFAFAPRAEADEMPQETPFDAPAQSLCERLSLIPGTRAHSFKETPTGLTGRLTDYGSGRTMDVRIDEAQPDLRPVRSE